MGQRSRDCWIKSAPPFGYATTASALSSAYIDWIRRFIFFNGTRRPRELGGAEIAQFLTHASEAREPALRADSLARLRTSWTELVETRGPG